MDRNYWKRMWYLWYPVLIRFAVSFAVSLAVTTLFISAEYMDKYEEIRQALVDGGNASELAAKLQETVMTRVAELQVPMGIATAAITIPIMVFLYHRDRKKERRQSIMRPAKAPFPKYVMIPVIAGALCIGLNNLILLADLPQYSEAYGEVMEAFYNPSFGIQLLYLGILSPVCEEYVFRGMMFRRMRSEAPFGYAAFYSALVFSIMHGNLVQVLYAFFMGLVFAYVFEKYGSLAAPVIAHITANIFSVIGTQFGWFEWIFQDIAHIAAVTAACAALASTMYVLMQRMESALEEVKDLEVKE